MKYILEVGARTVDDVLAAERGGADQVELYVSPKEGALTPSAGLIKSASRVVSHLKLNVMIRPRDGDFVYSQNEFATMQHDTEIAVEMGADGIMCGILNDRGNLDMKRMKDIIHRSGGKNFTIHRAFDFSRDPMRTLEEAVDLGCHCILSLGQKTESSLSWETLRAIIAKAGSRINIMLGCGSSFNTAVELEPLVREVGASTYHIVNGYRKRKSQTIPSAGQGNDDDYLKKTLNSIEYLSEDAVRELRDILDHC